MTRRFTARTFGVFAALLLASCIGDSTGPRELRPGFINIAPNFDVRGIHAVDVNRVLIRFTRPNSTVIAFDTIVPFPAATDTLSLSINLPVNGTSEQFLMTILMIDDPAADTVFQSGPTLITATAGAPPPTPTPVTFTYVGTGSKAAGVRFVTTPTQVLFGDTVVFTAEAFDSNNVVIPNTPIIFTSSDTVRARVPDENAGKVVGGIARGPVTITAALLTPPTATKPLLIQPKPNAVVVQGGSGQTGSVGAPLSQPVTVRVNAADNLGVAGVIVNFAVVTGGGSLSQLVDTTDVNGDASSIWTLGATLGPQSVSAAALGVPGSTTVPATGVVGTVKKLAFQVQPTNVATNTVIVPAVKVAAQDSFGNVVTSYTGSVAVVIGSNPGSSTLAGTTSIAATAGVATFSNLSLNNLGTGYTLSASATGLTSATSTTFDVAGGVPTTLVITQEPTNTLAGAAITPAITVQVRDGLGNPVPGATNTITVSILNNPAAGVLSGTASAAAVAGTATFPTLNIDKAGSGYTLIVTSPGLAPDTTVAFDISSGPATSLGFATQPPPSTIFQSPFTAVVTARDAGGNIAAGYTGAVTLTLGANPAGGTLFGTLTVNAVAGVATFSGISIDNIGAPYTLTANASGLVGTGSGSVNVVAPANANAWINSAGGNWNTPGNWSRGTVPNATDTIFIRQSGTYTVNLDVSSAALARLDVGAPIGVQTLSVAANTLTLAGNGAFTTAGKLVVSGGIVTGPGILDIFGSLDWTSGNFQNGSGTTRVNAGGTFTGSGVASRNLSAYTLELAGTGTLTGTHPIQTGSLGTFRVQPTGVLNVTGDPSFIFSLGGTPSVFDNLGTVNRTTSTGPFVMAMPLSGGGVWNVQSGILELQGGGTSNGAFTIALGATLKNAVGTINLGAASSVSGAGDVQFTGGTLNAAGGWNVTGNTVALGGTFNYNGASGTAAALGLANGVIGGSGLMNVSTILVWSGGNFTGTGGTARVLAGGSLNINGNTGRNLQNYVIEVAGTGTWTGTQTMNTGAGAVLRVLPGGSLDVQGDPTMLNNLGGTTTVLHVQGSFTRTLSGGTATINAGFQNAGTATVSAGTLRLTGGTGPTASTGSYTAASGGILEFSGGTHNLGAGSMVDGAGNVIFGGGTVNAAGGFNVTFAAQISSGGIFNYNGPGGSIATFNVLNGSLGGSSGSVLTVTNFFGWAGGNLTGTGGTLHVNAGATYSISGTAARNLSNYVLELAGSGNLVGTLTMGTGNAAILRVPVGGIFDIQGDPTIQFNLGGTITRIDILGTMTRTISGGAAVFTAPVNDSGSVQVQTGTLQLDGGGTAPSAFTVASGATLRFGGATYTMTPSSSVSGAGTVVIPAGTLNAAGSWSVTNTTLNGGIANFNGASMTTTNLPVTAGSLGGSGLLTVSGAMTWTGGNLAGAGGTTRVLLGATLALSPAGNLSNYVLELGGTGTWTGTGTINTGAAAVLRILPGGGNMIITGTPTFTQNLGGVATIIDNQGTFQKTTNAAAATMNVVFNSSGVVSVTNGPLSLQSGGSLSGTAAATSPGSIDFAGGTFSFANPFNMSGTGNANVPGGTLVTATSGDTAKFTTLNLTGGALNQTGTIRVNTGFVWQSGNVTGTGKVYVAPGVIFQLISTAARTFTNGTIENDGNGNWNGSFTLNTGLGAVLRNLPTRTFTLTGDGAFTQNQGGTLTQFDNQGAFVRNTSAGTATWTAAFNHTAGTVTVSTGVLSLNGGGLMTAPVTVTSPGFLDLGGNTFTLNNGFNATGTGAVRLQAGSVVTSTAADTARFANFTETGGNLGQTGGVVVSGLFDWSGGGMIGSGTTRVASGATMTMTGTSARTFTTGTLLNQGTTTWSGNFAMNAGLGAVWRNAAAAQVTLSGDGLYTLNQGGSATFDNLGGFTRNTSTNPTTWTAAFNHSGAATMAINSGTFIMGGGGTQSAGITVASGAFLDYAAGTFTLNNGLTETGTGVVRIQGGTITNATVADTARFVGLVLNSGTLGHIGGIVVQGAGSSVDWAGATTISGTGTMRISNLSTMSITGTAARTFTRGILLNQGTTNWSGTVFINSGIGAVWRNALGANLNVSANNPTISLNQGGTSILDNLGTVSRATGPANWDLNVAVTGNGSWNVTGGILDLQGGGAAGGGTITGATNISTGAQVIVNIGTWNYNGGGTITGVGTASMTVNGGIVNMNAAMNVPTLTVAGGIFAMGGSPVQVTGNFSTATGGLLNMTNAADSLDINGNASFGGGNSTLTNGVIRVAGNFTQTGSTSFRSQGGGTRHRVVLDGAGTQVVSWADPINSFFEILQYAKPNATQVQFVGTTHARVVNALNFNTVSLTSLGGAITPRLQADTLRGVSGHSYVSPLVIEIAGRIADSGSVNVDTVVFTGTGQLITTVNPLGAGSGSYVYKSVRVNQTSGTATFNQNTNLTNDLVVSNGLLDVNGMRLGVTGNFSTIGGGALRMVGINDSLGVGGNVSFGGGTTTAQLTRGVISLLGNFSQSGASTSYAPVSAVGSHRVLLIGTGTQNISFADAVNSFFDVLAVSATNTRNIVLQTNAAVGDSLIMFGGGSKSSLIGAGTSQHLRVNGVVRMLSSTQSALLAPPVLDLAGTLSLDSIFQALTGVNPDTLVYVAGTTFYTGSPVHYKSVRISNAAVTSFTSGNNETIAGDFEVTSGTLALSGTGQMIVTGDFTTSGTGALRMQIASSFLQVAGTAAFGGASTNGQLTNGVLQLKGNFVQGGGNAAAFAPSGAHITEFNGPVGVGTAVQTVSMANPGFGVGVSHFGLMRLARSNAGSALVVKLNLLTDIQAGRVADTSFGQNDSIIGTGTVAIQLDSAALKHTVFNNVTLNYINTTANIAMDTVRFENMNPASIYITLQRAGTAAAQTWRGITFATARTGLGRYILANVTSTGGPATINFTTSTTAGTFLAANSDYTRTVAVGTLPNIVFNGATNP